jgi:serine protease Do
MTPFSEAARARIAIVCALMISLCAVARADEPTTQQRIALAAKPSVVKIVAAHVATFEMDGRRTTASFGATGTGWFLTPDGYIATNAHVVADIQEGEEKASHKLWQQLFRNMDKQSGGKLSRMSKGELDQLERRIKMVDQKPLAFVVLPNGDKLNYEIKQYGKPHTGNDCAIIKVKTENAPTLSVGDSRKSQVGDPIVVIGYPGAADLEGMLDSKSLLQATVTDGVISALKNAESGEQILQISAPITHGNSGGPAVDQHGNVVGLATFGGEDARGQSVQGINFLVASTTLVELVKAERIEPKASDTTKSWNAGLDHYWANEYSEAVRDFEEVQLLFPQHSEAPNMIANANRAKKDGKEKQSSNTGVIAGFAVGGGVLLLGAIVIAARRRTAPRPVRPGIPMQSGPPPPPMAPGPPHMPLALPPGPPQIPGPSQVMYGGAAQPAPSAPLAKTFVIAPPAQQPRGPAPTVFGSFSIGSLTCMRGPLQGQRFALTATGIVIGRQPGVAHVLVNDHRASGKHVWIGIVQGQLVAIDQGTTNGTYINDIARGRISRAELRDGDVVIVGEPDCCSLQVRLG